MWRSLRYWLYIFHRWAGIVGCLLFVIWFASGLVMSYVGYPALEDEQRRAGLQTIDWTQVTVTPNELLAALPLETYPRELTLEMLLGKPVYRMSDWDRSRRTLSARQIANVGTIDAQQAVAIAGQFGGSAATLIATLERDQWTVPEQFTPFRPLHKVALADGAGTQVYVSSQTGEVVHVTTGRQRFWNWIGSVPHWIYFTPLRANQPAWRQVNLWVSGPAILIAVSGIWIGILRLRIARRYPNGAMSPYGGWNKWHHWAGIVGGAFLLTFILSGWLSVNPNNWLSGGGPARANLLAYAGAPGLRFDADLKALARFGDVKVVRFIYFDGRPLVVLERSGGAPLVVAAASGEPATISDAAIFTAAARLEPEHGLIERERIVADDAYWYSHHEHRPLPVLRAGFDDPESSWFYLDPATGELIGFLDDGERRYRWWFNALHRLDFTWLLEYRWLWHSVIIALCAMGLITSLSGVVIGWRRLRGRGNGIPE